MEYKRFCLSFFPCELMVYVHIRRVFLCIIQGSFTSPILILRVKHCLRTVALEWVNLRYIHVFMHHSSVVLKLAE